VAYASIVQERSTLRQMIHAANKIAESAYDTEGRTSDELLNEAEQLVFAIAENRPKVGGPEGVVSILQKTVDRIDELYRLDSSMTGIATGFTDLDGMTSGLQPSDLVIVAGRPSMGKTTDAAYALFPGTYRSD